MQREFCSVCKLDMWELECCLIEIVLGSRNRLNQAGDVKVSPQTPGTLNP
jgi:hypothetical protein